MNELSSTFHLSKRLVTVLLTALLLVGGAVMAVGAAPAGQATDGDVEQEGSLTDASIPDLVGGRVPARPVVRYQAPEVAAAAVDAPQAVTIDVWYGDSQDFGDPGTPQEWVNILGRVSGDGPFTLSYTLNGGASKPLSVGHQADVGNAPGDNSRNPRLDAPGDFNIELAVADLTDGANTVVITALDKDSNSVTKNVTVNYDSTNSWPTTYTAAWTGDVTDKAQVVDGLWSVSGGQVSPVEIGYDRALAIGDMEGWTDYEVTFPVTVNSVNVSPDIPGAGAGVGMIVRWQGHIPSVEPDLQPLEGWRRLGALGWYRWALDGTEAIELRGHEGKWIQATSDNVLEFGTAYNFKLSIQNTPSPTLNDYYRFKMWPANQPEPPLWDVEGYGKDGEPTAGSVLLLVHNADASVGTVAVKPVSSVSTELTTATGGTGGCNGTIKVVPDKEGAPWTYGEKVTLIPLPDEGCEFNGWSGDFSGLGLNPDNRLVFNITQDIAVTANFQVGTPKSLTVNVVGDGDVVVSPEKTLYDFGETVQLTAIPGADQALVGWSGDVTANINPLSVQMTSNKVITATFGAPDLVPPPVSDDFNRCELNTALWSYTDPVDDGNYETDGQQIMLSVPAGTEHNLWKTEAGRTIANRTVRVVQPAANVDFQVEAKFASLLDPRLSHQLQGILIEQDADTFLFFDFFSDLGVNPTEDDNNIRAYAGYVDGNTAGSKGGAVIEQNGEAMWQRVSRTGNAWKASYSFDGENWTQYASFTQALSVTKAGVFAGNAVGNPAHTATVDYFFNSAAPIQPEDAQGYGLGINLSGQGSVSVEPDQEAYACGESVTVTATADSGWAFTGWSGALNGSTNPQEFTFAMGDVVTASFEEDTTEPEEYTLTVNTVGNGSVSKSPDKTTYLAGDEVTLLATPDSGWTFTSWSGGISGSNNPFVLEITGNTSVVATFQEVVVEPDTFTLDVTKVGDGTITVTPQKESYVSGEKVLIEASPAAGWLFSGWSGGLPAGINPNQSSILVTMSQDRAITGTFTEEVVEPDKYESFLPAIRNR